MPSTRDTTAARERRLVFYPKYLFNLSPVYKTWARITAADVHQLTVAPGFEGQGIYFYLNHPISYVRLVGIITCFEQFDRPKRTCIHLDDGSGSAIELIYFDNIPGRINTGRFARPENAMPIDFRNIGLSSVVKVKGTIDEFRGTRQIKLLKIEVLKDTNEEVEAWKSASKFKRNVLMKPWFIDQKERERAEKKQRRALKLAAKEAERLRREGIENDKADEAATRWMRKGYTGSGYKCDDDGMPAPKLVGWRGPEDEAEEVEREELRKRLVRKAPRWGENSGARKIKTPEPRESNHQEESKPSPPPKLVGWIGPEEDEEVAVPLCPPAPPAPPAPAPPPPTPPRNVPLPSTYHKPRIHPRDLTAGPSTNKQWGSPPSSPPRIVGWIGPEDDIKMESQSPRPPRPSLPPCPPPPPPPPPPPSKPKTKPKTKPPHFEHAEPPSPPLRISGWRGPNETISHPPPPPRPTLKNSSKSTTSGLSGSRASTPQIPSTLTTITSSTATFIGRRRPRPPESTGNDQQKDPQPAKRIKLEPPSQPPPLQLPQPSLPPPPQKTEPSKVPREKRKVRKLESSQTWTRGSHSTSTNTGSDTCKRQKCSSSTAASSTVTSTSARIKKENTPTPTQSIPPSAQPPPLPPPQQHASFSSTASTSFTLPLRPSPSKPSRTRTRTLPPPPPPPPPPVPPSQPPPNPQKHSPRALKLLLLHHIHTLPLPTFTISTLRAIPEIESFALKVAAASIGHPLLPPAGGGTGSVPNTSSSSSSTTTPPLPLPLSAALFKTYTTTLHTLVQDGNLIHDTKREHADSAYSYVAVGRWNLGELVSREMEAVKRRSVGWYRRRRRREEQQEEVGYKRPVYEGPGGAGPGGSGRGGLAVREVWLKVKERGGGWEGVTKGVVGELVRELVEEENAMGGGGGEWRDMGRWMWEWVVDENEGGD